MSLVLVGENDFNTRSGVSRQALRRPSSPPISHLSRVEPLSILCVIYHELAGTELFPVLVSKAIHHVRVGAWLIER